MFLEKFKNRPVIIAEAGVNHNGDFQLARKLIEAAANANADIIKFQTFKAFECAGRYAEKAAYQSGTSAANQLELLQKLELPFSDFIKLKECAQAAGLEFLSTPDGDLSLDFLCQLHPCAIKIASGEITNFPFLSSIAATGHPIILSTGMASTGEVQKAVETLKSNGAVDLILLHCTTQYPAPDHEINLRAIQTLRQAFSLPTGFSDHSSGIHAAVAATALGAVVIEKHLTLDRNLPGPDHQASMNPHEFAEMVAAIRSTARMLGDGKKQVRACENENKKLVRRSLTAAVAINKGEILGADKISCKRPASGIAPELLAAVINRRVIENLAADEPITWNKLGEVVDFEP